MFAPYHPGRLLGHPMNESERLLLHQQKLQQAALLIQQEQQARRQQARRMDGERPRTPSQPGLAEMEGRSDDGLVCWPAWSALCCPERLDAFFRISERGSTVAQELRAGAVTFVTMAYILIVNAQILSKSGPDANGVWMNFDSIVAATAISAAVGSALVGIWGNLPFGLAPGMGLNSYFTYGICRRLGLAWPVALTACFFQGLLFIFLALIGACDLIQHYAPPCIKKSISVGLGLFQALIGFELMRLVIPGSETLLSLGDLADGKIWLCVSGMMLICVLLVWKVKAAMLVGIMYITLLSWVLGLTPLPDALVEMPTLQRPMAMLDFEGFFDRLDQTLPVVLVMLFVSVFDTAGVQYMCGSEADLLDPQTDALPGAKAAFASAGVATTIGAMLGTSPIIIHNETVAGISDGARTGLHSVAVAVLFLLSIPFVPILRAVPPIAAAAPLVIVGMCMLMAAKFIDWEKPHEGMPAFLCATILPFTYSIANGMLVGLASYAVLKSSHKLGEIFAPERMKVQPPRECVAKTYKCQCADCVREAVIDLVDNLTLDQQRQQLLLLNESGGGTGSVGSTPRRKAGRGDVFEDPMPGVQTFPFTSSSPVATRVHRMPSSSTGTTTGTAGATAAAAAVSVAPVATSYGSLNGHSHHLFRGSAQSLEGARSPPSPSSSASPRSSRSSEASSRERSSLDANHHVVHSAPQMHTHGYTNGRGFVYQNTPAAAMRHVPGERDPLIHEQSPEEAMA